MLQQETERLRTDIDKMRSESKFVTILSCINFGPSGRLLTGFVIIVVLFLLDTCVTRFESVSGFMS